jgi:hypothetical protein
MLIVALDWPLLSCRRGNGYTIGIPISSSTTVYNAQHTHIIHAYIHDEILPVSHLRFSFVRPAALPDGLWYTSVNTDPGVAHANDINSSRSAAS